MLHQLSSINIVLFIAAGIQTILLLFIFAKRQIMRFTLRSQEGPHVPIGQDTKKSFRKEIERKIQIIPRIQYEPRLDDCIHKILSTCKPISHFHRLKVVNDIKSLEFQIIQHDGCYKRLPHENIRGFLISSLSTTLNINGQNTIHKFCDLYEHARHDPSEFRNEEYEAYSKLLFKLINVYF